MTSIFPDYPGINIPHHEWEESFKKQLAHVIAVQVELKRVMTKFDGQKCSVFLGHRHGLYGPIFKAPDIFRNKQKPVKPKFKPRRFGLKAIRDVLRVSGMRGPASK